MSSLTLTSTSCLTLSFQMVPRNVDLRKLNFGLKSSLFCILSLAPERLSSGTEDLSLAPERLSSGTDRVPSIACHVNLGRGIGLLCAPYRSYCTLLMGKYERWRGAEIQGQFVPCIIGIVVALISPKVLRIKVWHQKFGTKSFECSRG